MSPIEKSRTERLIEAMLSLQRKKDKLAQAQAEMTESYAEMDEAQDGLCRDREDKASIRLAVKHPSQGWFDISAYHTGDGNWNVTISRAFEMHEVSL